MPITFDPAKRAANLEKHGVDFAMIDEFEWEAALVSADVRFEYPEPRLRALAPVGNRVFFVAFTVEDRSVRIISMRKANNKEVKDYEAAILP